MTVQTAYNLLLNFCMGTYIKYLKTILYRFFFVKAHVTAGWKYNDTNAKTLCNKYNGNDKLRTVSLWRSNYNCIN